MSGIDSAKLVRWYDFQAPCYRLWRNRYDVPLVAHVTAAAARLTRPDARILDAGCGTGLFAIALGRALPASRIVAIDLSFGMLAVAAREARRRDAQNARFSLADGLALPFRDDALDLAVAAGLLPNVNDRSGILRELARVLVPGGRLLVVEFDRDSMSTAVRIFFVGMILAYRAVSFVFRRFRFAEGWSVRSSTVARGEVECWAREAGLEISGTSECWGHLVFELAKGSGR